MWFFIWMLVSCQPSRPASSRPSAPDILLLTVDTLRPDRLGAYGHTIETPALDALAARGTRFTQAITPLPRTTPALASMMTGLSPDDHGSIEVGVPIARGARLAALLSAHGYTTIGLSGTPVAGPRQGFAEGFDAFEVVFDAPAPDLSSRALALVDAHAAADRPLFLWVHYVDPHFPYLPKNGDPAEVCWSLGEQAREGTLRRAVLFDNRDDRAAQALPSCWRLYDGEIKAVDAGIARLLASDRAGGWIVVSSDHGEHMGEEQLYFEHGPSTHEAALKIPLIVAGPGVQAGQIDDGLARLEDLAPTLLRAAGVPTRVWPEMLGEDLTPRLRGEVGPDLTRLAVVQSGSALQVPLHHQLRSGRADKHHCLNGPRFSLCSRPGQPDRLYDRRADPTLTVDVREAHPNVFTEYQAAAQRWPAERARQHAVRTAQWKLTATPRLAGGYDTALFDLLADPAERSPTTDPMGAQLAEHLRPRIGDTKGATRDAQTEDALRALGYVE